MPSLTFILSHWLYWTALAVFPLIAAWLVARERGRPDAGRPNFFLAYLFLVTAGFAGMHRFYLRNRWGFVFIPVFLAVLWTAGQVRDGRETISRTRVELEQAERALARAKASAARRPEGAETRIREAEAKVAPAREASAAAEATQDRASTLARIAAIVLGLMLLGDAVLIPGLVREARKREPLPPPPVVEAPLDTAVPSNLVHSPAAKGLGLIDRLVRVSGEFVAYWAVLAVFAYYYEVVARYVFNSPTNWVHESMFLMFGMQYMIAGAYAYRDETHVRVDILYSQLSPRGRAICDVITSVFFFIFVGTMMVTGWTFAHDAIAVRESSFTEWGVQYWPVKLAIPIGAALLLLQGFARLTRDIAIVTRRID
ncbi:TRAP transporter small permease subunit [Microvirga massiliensis]|uniref:TRAP transporter small permease subunit n=1 Tax=Microvirga massiliensis TaxID=1033741 RepID=UPI00062B4DEE|nr:TRAP transporter small permease subunit [Microvirga massiliensis]